MHRRPAHDQFVKRGSPFLSPPTHQVAGQMGPRLVVDEGGNVAGVRVGLLVRRVREAPQRVGREAVDIGQGKGGGDTGRHDRGPHGHAEAVGAVQGYEHEGRDPVELHVRRQIPRPRHALVGGAAKGDQVLHIQEIGPPPARARRAASLLAVPQRPAPDVRDELEITPQCEKKRVSTAATSSWDTAKRQTWRGRRARPSKKTTPPRKKKKKKKAPDAQRRRRAWRPSRRG